MGIPKQWVLRIFLAADSPLSARVDVFWHDRSRELMLGKIGLCFEHSGRGQRKFCLGASLLHLRVSASELEIGW